MTLDKKLESFLPKKTKPTNASMLFPQLQKDLTENPELAGSLDGLFVIMVLKNGKLEEEWFLSFYGRNKPPSISQSKPSFPTQKNKLKDTNVAIIQVEDRDILKFVTGGLPGFKAINEGRVKIAGDLSFALQLEEVFNKAGGVEKVKEFLKQAKLDMKSKL